MVSIEQQSFSGPDERPSTPYTGIDKLYDWLEGEPLINVEPALLAKSQQIHPFIRGIQVTSNVKALDLLKKSPVFQWYQHDKQGILLAAARDADLRNAINSITTIIDSAASISEDAAGTRELFTLALVEKIFETSIVGAPHVPHNFQKKLHQPEWKNFALQPLLPFASFFSLWRNWMEKHKEQIDIPDLPKRESHLPRIQLPSFSINLPFHFEGSSTADSKKSRKQLSDDVYSHPLIDGFRQVGKERSGEMAKKKQKMILVHRHRNSRRREDSFVVTRKFNSFNAEKGILQNDSKNIPYTIDTSLHPTITITALLGKINLENIPELALPFPVDESSTVRQKDHHRMLALADISMTDSDEQLWLGSHDLGKYLVEDNNGNLFLAVQDMPSDLKHQFNKKALKLIVQYAESPTDQKKWQTEFIGPMEPSEYYRLYLYPKEIAAFVHSLQKKKQQQLPGFQTNEEIFRRLSQFIGNTWLTYDLKDAVVDEKDPIGFQQTERVLARRRASCEGANITLGQLMRYFLEEGEGILYTEGFVVYAREYALVDDFHLKVVYVDRDKKEHYFDATPWSDESHRSFKRAVRNYTRAKKEWIRVNRHIHRNEQLSVDADNLYQRFVDAWSTPTGSEVPKDLYNSLPGRFDSDSFFSFINLAKPKGGPKDEVMAKIFHHFTSGFNKYPDSYMSIIRFLYDVYNVSDSARKIFPNPTNNFDVAVDLDIGFLDQPLYKSLSMSPNDYISGLKGNKILFNHLLRSGSYRKMAKIIEKSQPIAQQNIEVLTYLCERLEQVNTVYTQKLKRIFQTVSHKMPQGVDTFFDQAPFIMLLPHPLDSFGRFFHRSVESDTLGFLLPDDIPTLDKKWDAYIAMWERTAEKKLAKIQALIDSVPETLTSVPNEVYVSSLMLWEEVAREYPIKYQKNDEPVFIDAMQTLEYLHNELKKPKR